MPFITAKELKASDVLLTKHNGLARIETIDVAPAFTSLGLRFDTQPDNVPPSGYLYPPDYIFQVQEKRI